MNNFWKTVGLFENTENPEYDLFMELLTRMTAQPEENESDVFSIGQDDAKWIRYKVIESDDTSIGVIMDVTSEILEKMMIKSAGFERQVAFTMISDAPATRPSGLSKQFLILIDQGENR